MELELPRCTPEAAGIPSAAVARYIRSLCASGLAMHDVLIMRHGRLCFEGYWKPFDASFRHRLYSCSKSIASCAVGVLCENGTLSLEDKVLSFFPDKAPKEPHPWLAEMTVRDLLCMSTCFDEGTNYSAADPDWEDTYFSAVPTHKPGQVYHYCTTGSSMLCSIVKRASGMQFMEVLRPAFDALGISKEAFCVEQPCGVEWGGSGVCMTAREFLAFSDLCTHYGLHKGRQLLPRAYMLAATGFQIDNSVCEHTGPDSGVGYGYQFRRMRRGFCMRGMGGQFALCLPEYDLTLITNAYDRLSEERLTEIFDAFFREIEPALCDAPLAEDTDAQTALFALADSLTLPLPLGARTSPMAHALNGRVYRMAENPLDWKWLRFAFTEDGGTLHYENATGIHALPFGTSAYAEAPFPETQYSGVRIGTPLGRGYRALTAAAWPSQKELVMLCQIADIYHGNLRISFAFEQDTVTLFARKHAEWFLDTYEGFASGAAHAEGQARA